jgi:hypothetical protein
MIGTKFDAEREARGLIFFILALVIREFYSFVLEDGLSGKYPLCKSLFYMMILLASMALLFVPTIRGYVKRLGVVETTVQDLLKKLRREDAQTAYSYSSGTRTHKY